MAEFLQLLSIIILGPTDPSRCFADGPGIGKVFKQIAQTFTIFSRDSSDNFRRECSDNVSVGLFFGNSCLGNVHSSHCKPQDSCVARGVELKIAACNDGTWVVAYILQAPGSYQVKISINEKQILGSPYCLTVQNIVVEPPRICSVVDSPLTYSDVMVQRTKIFGAGCLDVALACDATYSMDSAIEMCKHRMLSIISAVKQDSAVCERVRLGLCFFRDHPPQDRTFVTSVWDLTENHESIQKQIRSMDAMGIIDIAA